MLAPIVAAAAVALAAPAGGKLVHFTSPSGNINCLGSTAGPEYVSCLVRRASWPRRPARPRGCDLDWIPTEVGMSRRRVSVGSCRGDVGPLCGPRGSGLECTTLAYGRSVTIGPIRCTSATNGVTCRYRTAPRVGFRVAREGYVIYRP